jgi:Uri superfamily endonuclease
MMAGTNAPGSYLLLIRTDRRLELAVGRLGVRVFPRGWHVYAGSARGGLAARLRHHLEPDRPVHWHVDVLRRAGHVAAVWAVEGRDRHECALARAVAALPGARLSPDFGSSDCRCPGHLISFPRSPALDAVWPGLALLRIVDTPSGRRYTATITEGARAIGRRPIV